MSKKIDHLIEIKSQRLDKWMWHARIAKTRSLCAKLISSGNVKINDEKISKASRLIQLDETITVTLPRRAIIYQVKAFAETRGNATLASELFIDHTPISIPKEINENSYPQREKGEGRPTKKQRRQIASLKSKSSKDMDW